MLGAGPSNLRTARRVGNWGPISDPKGRACPADTVAIRDGVEKSHGTHGAHRPNTSCPCVPWGPWPFFTRLAHVPFPEIPQGRTASPVNRYSLPRIHKTPSRQHTRPGLPRRHRRRRTDLPPAPLRTPASGGGSRQAVSQPPATMPFRRSGNVCTRSPPCPQGWRACAGWSPGSRIAPSSRFHAGAPARPAH